MTVSSSHSSGFEVLLNTFQNSPTWPACFAVDNCITLFCDLIKDVIHERLFWPQSRMSKDHIQLLAVVLFQECWWSGWVTQAPRFLGSWGDWVSDKRNWRKLLLFSSPLSSVFAMLLTSDILPRVCILLSPSCCRQIGSTGLTKTYKKEEINSKCYWFSTTKSKWLFYLLLKAGEMTERRGRAVKCWP